MIEAERLLVAHRIELQNLLMHFSTMSADERIDRDTQIKNAWAVCIEKTTSYQLWREVKSKKSGIPNDQQEKVIKDGIRENVRSLLKLKAKNAIEAKQIKTLYTEIQNDRYLQECFDDYIDLHSVLHVVFHRDFLPPTLYQMRDPRDAYSMKDVSKVKMLGSGNGSEREVQLAKGLIKKYPDFYILYHWLGAYHRHHHNLAEAKAILADGIKHSIQKHDLYADYGLVEKEESNLQEAVKWWIKSAILQVISINSLDDYRPFMYLAYVASNCGLEQESSKLLKMADCIMPIRLTQDEQYELRKLYHNIDMKKAVKLFVATFIDRFQESPILFRYSPNDTLKVASVVLNPNQEDI